MLYQMLAGDVPFKGSSIPGDHEEACERSRSAVHRAWRDDLA
jgi:hypothetical protein